MFHRGFPLATDLVNVVAGRRGRVESKMFFSLLVRSSFQSQLAFRKRLGALGTASSVMEREPFSSERQETQSR